MNTDKILIITEANIKVASGHLIESIVCYQKLLGNGKTVSLMVNADLPEKLKDKLPDSYVEYKSNIQEEEVFLCEYLEKHEYKILIFNLREIANKFIENIKKRVNVFIICIDEFGNRELSADVIINPMIDDYYWNYKKTNALLYCGAQYLVLPPKLEEYHIRQKKVKDTIEVITVSMGGVDAVGTTLKIARWMSDIEENISVNLVLGGGFQYKEQLLNIVGNNPKFKVYENIDYLFELFYQSDLAICAGGNTLHELAAIGVPTLVIPSMPHEVRNGQAFEVKGFSYCCSLGEGIQQAEFTCFYNKIRTYEVRKQMSRIGKEITDGKGCERLNNILDEIGKNYCED